MHPKRVQGLFYWSDANADWVEGATIHCLAVIFILYAIIFEAILPPSTRQNQIFVTITVFLSSAQPSIVHALFFIGRTENLIKAFHTHGHCVPSFIQSCLFYYCFLIYPHARWYKPKIILQVSHLSHILRYQQQEAQQWLWIKIDGRDCRQRAVYMVGNMPGNLIIPVLKFPNTVFFLFSLFRTLLFSIVL